MKTDWEVKKLGEVCEKITDGSHFSPKSSDVGEYPYVTVRDIEQDHINFEECKFIDENSYKALLKNGCQPLKGDILYSKDGTVGKVSLVDFEKNFVVLSSLAIIRPKKEIISSELLKHILKSPLFLQEALGKKTGAAIRRIILNNLKQIEIRFPKSLPEQQRIVAILDEAFAAIDQVKANAKRNLQNAKELFDSYLQSVFANPGEDWEEKTLQEIVDTRCTLSYGIVQPGDEFPGGLPIIRPTDLVSKFIPLNGLKLIDPQLAESYKRTTLMGNELLLCVRGNTGIISIATATLKGANVTRGIVPISFKSELMSVEFGYYQFISQFIHKQIKAKTYGTALMQINIGDLRKILVLIPSIKDQQNIVTKLDALYAETTKLEAIYQQKLIDLDELKKSILQKAFRGELTKAQPVALCD